jgi:hypothetical protein
MYHRIKQLNCRPLQKLNDLARLTIEFGLTQERNDPSPYQLLKRDFCKKFTTAGYPNAGKWLWRHWGTIRNPLITLLAIPLLNKQAVLTSYDFDTVLFPGSDRSRCFANQTFSMSSLDGRFAPALVYVNEILGNFYTDILTADNGIPGNVINEVSPLTRQSVLQAYLNEQDEIYVCPGCDGNPPEVDADRRVYEDVDHYFPKSIYPFLSVHPQNLTPLCSHCNQRFKGQKDPLELDDGTFISLSEACHPYLHNVREEVSIRFERRDNELHLKLVATDNCHENRLRSIKYLIQLESRWDGDLQEYRQDGSIHMNRINEPFADYYRFALDLLPESQVTKDWLRTKIERSIAPSLYRSIGQKRRGVAAYEYARWVATDDAELEKWLVYATEMKVKVEVLPT